MLKCCTCSRRYTRQISGGGAGLLELRCPAVVLVHAVVIAASRADEDRSEIKHLIDLIIYGFRGKIAA
jgi:hypothetical protein